MRIHRPQIRIEGGKARIFAPVELDRPAPGIAQPFLLWYEFPERYADLISKRTDGFVVALLPLAMRLGERLQAEGVLSAQLEHGLREYQRIFSYWFPHLQTITVACDGYEPADPDATTGAVGSFFSGGVDSFFTLWSHLPEREPNPGFRITHGVFIHGFDDDLKDEHTFQEALRIYQQAFGALGLTLIPVSTNLKHLVNRATTGWRPAFGAFLISIPLLLQGLFRRFYVPASDLYGYTPFPGKYGVPDGLPHGSDPLVDHLLSTESLQMIHDGAHATRMEKTATIAGWPVTYDLLYVCFVRQGTRNCCRCEKCVRSMIALELTGALERYRTFPHPLSRRAIRQWQMPSFHTTKDYAVELYEHARQTGRREVAADLRYMLLSHRVRWSRMGRLCRKLFVLPAKRVPSLVRLHTFLKGRGRAYAS